MPVSRKQIVTMCQTKRGWTVQPQALHRMESFLRETNQIGDNNFFTILDPVMKKLGKKTVSLQVWESAMEEYERSFETMVDDTTSEEHLRVVSALESPRLLFQTMRRQFHVEENQWSLFGTAEDKVSWRNYCYCSVHLHFFYLT